ncbi:hypothetical protein [Gimesia sp.]|uniref:hypothetical protein n=1 Tax=Gimesia sp. TaxID=2024833 RepID=UPI003A933B3B
MNHPDDMSSEETIYAEIEPVADVDASQELARLKWLVERYEVVVGVFAHSLTDEFLPSEEALKDWVNNLSLLREASFPISDYLHKNAEKIHASTHRAYFQRVNSLISQAIRVLIEGKLDESPEASDEPTEVSDDPICVTTAADLLIQANLKLRSASTVLVSWSKEFKSIDAAMPQSLENAVPRRAVVERLLDRQEQRLQSLADYDDVSTAHVHKQCMASRKLYLLCHFMATLYPDMWTQERLNNLLKVQENLIKRMCDGSPSRQSVTHRRNHILSSAVLNPWGSSK